MNEKYWFARGYYDGRSVGTITETFDGFPDYLMVAYMQGYESGVADCCFEFDGEV